ncbi:MAG: hypothetical protein ACI84C_002213 [Flavobacteriales bacterium]|jgi:hypothetical protein
MRKSRYTLVAIAVLAILQSCTERIELDLNDEDSQRMVVEGWITNEEMKHEIELTETTSYFFEEAAPRVSGATVTITDGDSTWDLDEEEPGKYRTPLITPQTDKWYTLTINHDGEEYTATSYMRPTFPLDSLNVRVLDPLEEFGFPADPYYSVRIWTQEVPGTGDSYMWTMNVNSESVRDTLNELSFVNDDLYDGIYVPDVEIHSLEIDIEATIGDTVEVIQWNIGREGYDVFVGILNETAFNGGLFDAPPANVNTNISNGAVGYFGAAGVTRRSTIINE